MALKIRACIVGAGVSGLRCAEVLLENGFDVTIYEARDRIGGRVTQSNEMGPMEVDIGANWVHSTGQNPIFELAHKTGTEVHLWDPETLIVDKKGNLVDPVHANRALQIVWQILEAAIEYSKSSSDQIDTSKSLYDFFEQQCRVMSKEGILGESEVETVLGMSEMWGAYVGARVERQSLKYFFLEDCIDADDYFIPHNYKKIVSEIARKPMEQAKVNLSTRVISIKAHPADCNNIEIRSKGRETECFDAVVVTSPLGFLKRNMDFIKPLECPVADAILAISYGNLEKVLVEFPTAFWEDSHTPAPSFVHWLAPAYASSTNPQAWRLECVSFSVFPTPYRRNILLFYTYGGCSLHITSLVKGKVGFERHEILLQFFEPYYSRLPNWNSTTCNPVRFLATEWSNDELSGYGSYSDFQVGIDKADDHVRALTHGMPEHNIYFAGEHAAPFDGLGTVAGAYNSGQRVAERLAGKYAQ